jgi:hypothetical protein
MSVTPTITNPNTCPFVFDSSVDVTREDGYPPDDEYQYTLSFSGEASTNAIYPANSTWCVSCCKDWCDCGWLCCWWCCNYGWCDCTENTSSPIIPAVSISIEGQGLFSGYYPFDPNLTSGSLSSQSINPGVDSTTGLPKPLTLVFSDRTYKGSFTIIYTINGISGSIDMKSKGLDALRWTWNSDVGSWNTQVSVTKEGNDYISDNGLIYRSSISLSAQISAESSSWFILTASINISATGWEAISQTTSAICYLTSVNPY